MEDRSKKIFLLILTIVIGIILVVVTLIVYNEIVKTYGRIDIVENNMLHEDEYIISMQNKVVKGREILNTLRKYKNDRDKINVSYNYYKGGPYDTFYSNSNWDIAINNFLTNGSRYADCLDKKYLVTTSQTSNTGVLLIVFSFQN